MSNVTNVPLKSNPPPALPAHEKPFTSIETMTRDFERFFGNLWLSPFGLSLVPRPDLNGTAWPLVPAVDIAAHEGYYELSAELPGLDAGDINVRLVDHTLVIEGEKKQEVERHETDFRLSERRYGAFKRTFDLPKGVDLVGVEASFAKGVLKIKLPKSADARQNEKKVEVKAA